MSLVQLDEFNIRRVWNGLGFLSKLLFEILVDFGELFLVLLHDLTEVFILLFKSLPYEITGDCT